MIDSNFKLEGNAPTVTWADPKSSPEHSAAAAQVLFKERVQSICTKSSLLTKLALF